MCKHCKLLVAAFLLMFSLLATAQEQQKVIKHTTAKPTSPASGQQMYTSYCAVCHGKDGKGGGPAADALKVPPADLSALAKKNGGKFPSDHVSSVIRGEANVPAHGSKEMPVWGPVFWRLSHGSSAVVQQRISNLTSYVESLQAK
jgi:mono/diheme cytochrome c family protein